MGISEDLKAALCPKPCKGPITRSQRRLMPDGSVEVSGELPPPPYYLRAGYSFMSVGTRPVCF